MTEEPGLQMEFEPVDDIPLLLQQMKIMALAQTIDAHIKPHGNWQGLSFGPLACLALTHILSQADHRLCAILPWAQERRHTLDTFTEFAWEDRDLSDDRLAILLRHFCHDDSWFALESALNHRTIEVFELNDEFIRLDSTTGSGRWQILADGLFQRGHSKDKRPDLPQIRVMMGSIDPLGSPMYTQIYSGNRTDDRLYVPAVERIKEGLGRDGLLFVGDCKMGSQRTRATIASGRDYYLCPLAGVQLPNTQKETIIQTVLSGEVDPIPMTRQCENSEELELIGYGYETTAICEYDFDEKPFEWEERHLTILSLSLMEQTYDRLKHRVAKAQAELAELNVRKQGKKLYRELEPLQLKVSEILTAHRVEKLIEVDFPVEVQRRMVRKWGERPARCVEQTRFLVETRVDEKKLFDAAMLAGWRVYATNAPAHRLELKEAYLGYRKSHRIDGNCFRRLKGAPLNLTPTYLSRPDHVKGMVRLLSLGLRVLSELEYVARCALDLSQEKLAGLYPGNPKRSTDRPTAVFLLRAFKNIALLGWKVGALHRWKVTPLSDLQKRILLLLGFPEHIYQRLENNGTIFRTPS